MGTITTRTRAALALTLAFVVLATGGCWPQLGGNPGRTFWNEYETSISPDNVARLEKVFTVEGAQLRAVVGANLLVTEPRIVGEETTVDVVSYHAATGAERWRRAVPGPIVSSLVVVGGEAWYGWRTSPSDPVDCDAAIERVNVNTGAPVATIADLYPFELLVMEGGVYTVTATGAAACSYPQPTGFEVRDPKTGAVRWRGPYGRVPAAANGYVFNQPVPADGSAPSQVRAYDADGCGAPTCNGLWTATLGGPGEMMAARNGQVYVQNIGLLGQSFTGVDQRTGLTLSVVPLPHAYPTVDAAADADSVYTAEYSWSGVTTLRAYTAAGCSVLGCVPRWSGQVPHSISGHHVVAGDVVFVAAGAVYAFDAAGCGQATCAPLVELPAGANEVMVAGGRVYAASDDGGGGGAVTAYAVPAS